MVDAESASSMMDEDDLAYVDPWYTDLTKSQPYTLVASATSADINCSNPSLSVACFPWSYHSLRGLWNGEINDEGAWPFWDALINKWKGVIAVGGKGKLRLMLSTPDVPLKALYTIELLDPNAEVKAVAWCLLRKFDEFWPLLAFSCDRIMYIYDVEHGKYHGITRGHGGNITSIAVNPVEPRIICTTAYDHSVRIYDLTLDIQTPDEYKPSWPRSKKPCLGGAAFGLRANEGEGEGLGRCVAILSGGPSGGHQDGVKYAAFNPNMDIIATCGIDHCVKIWRLPILDGKRLRRVDKPLFSTSHIHSSQVLSINWIAHDILLSHSAPITLRDDSQEPAPLYKIPGKVILWRWLGFDRFFPGGHREYPHDLRGCASDYENSSSYKIISEIPLPRPLEKSPLHMHRPTSDTRPLMFLGSPGIIRMFTTQHFKPRKPPPFPGDDAELEEATQKLRMSENAADEPEFPGWSIQLEKSKRTDKELRIEMASVGDDGRMIVAVGEEETLWVWRRDTV